MKSIIEEIVVVELVIFYRTGLVHIPIVAILIFE
jgi:hypothetical protein